MGITFQSNSAQNTSFSWMWALSAIRGYGIWGIIDPLTNDTAICNAPLLRRREGRTISRRLFEWKLGRGKMIYGTGQREGTFLAYRRLHYLLASLCIGLHDPIPRRSHSKFSFANRTLIDLNPLCWSDPGWITWAWHIHVPILISTSRQSNKGSIKLYCHLHSRWSYCQNYDYVKHLFCHANLTHSF